MNRFLAVAFFSLFSLNITQAAPSIEEIRQTRIAFEDYTLHEVETEDRVRLHMLELLGQDGKPMTHGKPVLLVHGYTSNWNTWYEIGDQLRRKGYRVFASNWRGHGQAEHRSMPHTNHRRPLVFDDLAVYDVPAVLEAVSKITGRSKIIYVGHSMGGMQMHLALAGVSRNVHGELVISEAHASRVASKLAGFVAVGSPVNFPKAEGMLDRLAHSFMSLAGVHLDKSALSGLHQDPLLSLALNAMRDHHFHLGRSLNMNEGLVNLRNISRFEFDMLLDFMGSNVPREFVSSLANNTGKGYASADGRIDYALLSMGEIGNERYFPRVPTLLISAEHDALAPLADQSETARRRGISQVILEGARHVDMVMGKNAALVTNHIDQIAKRPSTYRGAHVPRVPSLRTCEGSFISL